MVYFWNNLKNLKDFWLVSIADVCKSLNEAIPGLDMTRGKLDYIFRCRSDSAPTDNIVNAVNRLFCRDYGLEHDQFNILDHELNAYELAYLATGKHIHDCSMDKTVWIRNFWSNYRWIEVCYQQIGRPVPGWKNAGHYTYTLRKNQDIIPPKDVLEEFGKAVDLQPYPMTYLKRFDGMDMLDKLIYIQNPSLKNEQYMEILSETKEKHDDEKNNNNSLQSGQVESLNGVHSDDEKARDLLVWIARKRFLWANGFLSDEKYRELDWMIASLVGLKDDGQEAAFLKSGKSIQGEFWNSIKNAINEGADRLKKRWDELNP